MTYSLRIRFVIGPHHRLNSTGSELTIGDPITGQLAALKPTKQEETIDGTQSLVLVAHGFESEEIAFSEAGRWRAALEVAFARLLIGVDFGDRAAKSQFTEAGLRALEEEHKTRVLNDEHGVMVYLSEPTPQFASTHLDFVVGKPPDEFTNIVTHALERRVMPSEQQRLAFDLFSSSFFQTSADSRFMALMMAFETLLEPQARSDAARTHVDELIRLTRMSSLPPNDVNSMVGSLTWLKNESIGQAGRRLAASAGDLFLMDGTEDAVTFFTKCYDLRGRLVHGHQMRPERGDVDVRAASLERLLGHLLSQSLGLPPRV